MFSVTVEIGANFDLEYMRTVEVENWYGSRTELQSKFSTEGWVQSNLMHCFVWSTYVQSILLMRSNIKAETAFHGCLIPAVIIWLSACVGWWPYHEAGETCVHLVFTPFFMERCFTVFSFLLDSNRARIVGEDLLTCFALAIVFNRIRLVEACNSHNKPMSRHFYRLIYF